MIRRFSLYGFLKNQKYYEPFIILFFLEKGLSFTEIGFLVAFRELCINLMEIPSGAVADLYGRRRSMMLSFLAYIVSFALFSIGRDYPHFFVAMFFFSIGEAFRTGTHKAMIFTWLRLRDRADEKVKVYGYTRSWSKIGSACSILFATFFVIAGNNYTSVFYYSIIPYLLGLVNFLGYPKELDGRPDKNAGPGVVFSHFRNALRRSVQVRPLRRLIVESMAFEGVFKASKDYLQPILKSLALSIPVFVAIDETRRSAILVGVVYFVLHLGSAWASRKSHRIADLAGGERAGSRLLWKVNFLAYGLLVPLLFLGYYVPAVIAFVCLHLLQNVWRPILISRFQSFAAWGEGATVLSIESQAKTVSTMIIAPLLGFAVDLAGARGPGGEFWPAAAVGVLAAFYILATMKKD